MFALSQIYGVPVSSLAERFELCLMQRMFPQDPSPAIAAWESAMSSDRSAADSAASASG